MIDYSELEYTFIIPIHSAFSLYLLIFSTVYEG